MGLVKTRRLAAMQKKQRAKAGMRMKALPKGPFASADKIRDARSGKSAPAAPKRCNVHQKGVVMMNRSIKSGVCT